MLAEKYAQEIQAILTKYPPEQRRAAVMPLIYLTQREKMYVNRDDMAEIGAILGISATDVASVVGFYSLYYDQPKGKYHIQVCTDLPCALRGSERFMQELCKRLNIQPGETTSDGMVTVEPVMCLAACDKAPMFQVQSGAGLQYFEHQTVESALALIEQLRADAARRFKTPLERGGTGMVNNGYVLLRHREIPDLDNLEVYRQNNGFKAFEKVVTKMQPGEVTELVKASGLRGRGGAGFPTGVKWSFIDNKNWPHYVVANADESEPGTFKDREILEGNPYQFLEGVAICAYAVQAHAAYVYLRGEFWELAERLDRHIAAMEAAGLLGEKLFGSNYSLHIYTHLGAGAYICGEETALLEFIEGKLGQPRLRPPFPAAVGLFGKPTVVNNVETLTNLPLILERGAEWHRSIGTEKSPGVKIFSLSGCVQNPGNYELPLGTTFRQLVFEHGGGIPEGHAIKAIMAAGASSSLIVANEQALDTRMDYESVPSLGAQLGSASVIVIDDSVGIPWLINKTMHFFRHESCGKCTPCREGTFWMSHITERMARQVAVSGLPDPQDVKLLYDVANQVRSKCLCALGEFSIEAVTSGIDRFHKDFELAAGEPQAATGD